MLQRSTCYKDINVTKYLLSVTKCQLLQRILKIVKIDMFLLVLVTHEDMLMPKIINIFFFLRYSVIANSFMPI